VAFTADGLMRLWDGLPAGPAALEAAFREVYADPVVVNGERRTLPELAAMASAMRGVFAGTRREPAGVVQAPGQVAAAFRLRGRHVGPLPAPLGTVPPAGRTVELKIIDILTISDGLIGAVQMVADNLDLLLQLGAVTLAGLRGFRTRPLVLTWVSMPLARTR
jgi:predicted ester cyclase